MPTQRKSPKAKAAAGKKASASDGQGAVDPPAQPAQPAPAEPAAPAPVGGAADLSQVLALLTALQQQGAATLDRLTAVEGAQTAQAEAFTSEGADIRAAIDDTRAQVQAAADSAVATRLARVEKDAADHAAIAIAAQATADGQLARRLAGEATAERDAAERRANAAYVHAQAEPEPPLCPPEPVTVDAFHVIAAGGVQLNECLLPGCSKPVFVNDGTVYECCGVTHARDLARRRGATCGFKACAKSVYVSESGVPEHYCSKAHAVRATTPRHPGAWYSGTELARREEAEATALIAEAARQEAVKLAADAARAAAAAVPTPLDPVQQQLLILTQQLTALTTVVAATTAAATAADKPKDEDKDEDAPPSGPWPPYINDVTRPDCTPFQPFRPPGTPSHPHVYPVAQGNLYYKALSKKKSATFYEYSHLWTQLDYQFDRLQTWERLLPCLLAQRDELDTQDARDYYQAQLAIYNSDLQQYQVWNRRRNMVELRCRVNFAEIDSLPGDARILAALELRSEHNMRGFSNHPGLDPEYKKYIAAFEKKSAAAELTAHAKASGQDAAKYSKSKDKIKAHPGGRKTPGATST